eukprot:4787442-Pleurochrysis_carterae.AAC.2
MSLPPTTCFRLQHAYSPRPTARNLMKKSSARIVHTSVEEVRTITGPECCASTRQHSSRRHQPRCPHDW